MLWPYCVPGNLGNAAVRCEVGARSQAQNPDRIAQDGCQTFGQFQHKPTLMPPILCDMIYVFMISTSL